MVGKLLYFPVGRTERPRTEYRTMPITHSTVGVPPSRTRDDKLAAAMLDLGPHYRKAKEDRDVNGAEHYQILSLDSEDEAKLYARAFHKMAGNENRVANCRLHGSKVSVRLAARGTERTKRERKPKAATEAPKPPTAPPKAPAAPPKQPVKSGR